MGRKKKEAAEAAKPQEPQATEWNEFCTNASREVNKEIMAIVNKYCGDWEKAGVPPHIIATMNMMICLDSLLLSGGLAALAYPDPIKFYSDAIPKIAQNSIPFFEKSYSAFKEALDKRDAMLAAATQETPPDKVH